MRDTRAVSFEGVLAATADRVWFMGGFLYLIGECYQQVFEAEVRSNVRRPRPHLVLADATVALPAMAGEPVDQPSPGLLRGNHRLHAEGAGQCVRRGVARQFGLQSIEALGVVLALDAVEHADPDLRVHEADIGAGPGSH